jgi:hypothetical protein
MLLGGLWHGANYKFIIWGGLHGLALAAERWWKEQVAPRISFFRIPRVVGVFVTFHFVCFAWIFFRANDMSAAKLFILRIVTQFKIGIMPEIITAYCSVFVVILLAFGFHFVPSQWKERCNQCFIHLPVAAKIMVIVALVFLMYQMLSVETQPFIYFQF